MTSAMKHLPHCQRIAMEMILESAVAGGAVFSRADFAERMPWASKADIGGIIKALAHRRLIVIEQQGTREVIRVAMSAPDQRKAVIKAAIAAKLKANAELHARHVIGLNDLRRDLAWKMPHEPLTQDGRFMAKMLNALGWRRDGWLGTGYDRQARYVPEARS